MLSGSEGLPEERSAARAQEEEGAVKEREELLEVVDAARRRNELELPEERDAATRRK